MLLKMTTVPKTILLCHTPRCDFTNGTVQKVSVLFAFRKYNWNNRLFKIVFTPLETLDRKRWGMRGGKSTLNFNSSFKKKTFLGVAFFSKDNYFLVGGSTWTPQKKSWTFHWPMGSFTVKENHIGPVISRIMRYTQTHRLTSCYFYAGKRECDSDKQL